MSYTPQKFTGSKNAVKFKPGMPVRVTYYNSNASYGVESDTIAFVEKVYPDGIKLAGSSYNCLYDPGDLLPVIDSEMFQAEINCLEDKIQKLKEYFDFSQTQTRGVFNFDSFNASKLIETLRQEINNPSLIIDKASVYSKVADLLGKL